MKTTEYYYPNRSVLDSENEAKIKKSENLEDVVKEIKIQLHEAIDNAFKDLHNANPILFHSKHGKEFEMAAKKAKDDIINAFGDYVISKFKINKIEKSPSPLYCWIVEEVTTRFDTYLQNEKDLQMAPVFF